MVLNPNSQRPSLPISSSSDHSGEDLFDPTGPAPGGRSPRDRSPLSFPSSDESTRNLSVSETGYPLVSVRSRKQSTRTFASGFTTRSNPLTPAEIAACPSTSDLGIENEEYAEPLATSQCLQNFADVTARGKNQANIKRGEEKKEYVRLCQDERAKHQAVLEQLRGWRRRQRARKTIKGWLKSSLEHKWQLPRHDELVAMVHYYYPSRADVKIYICDFGADRFKKRVIRMGDLDKEFSSKPDWADVRWM